MATKQKDRPNSAEELLKNGAIYGVGAFVAGAALVLVFENGSAETSGSLAMYGWYHMFAEATAESQAATSTATMYSEMGAFALVATLFPGVPLTIFGFLNARQYDVEGSLSGGEAMKLGAGIAGGYTVALLLLALSVEGTIQPGTQGSLARQLHGTITITLDPMTTAISGVLLATFYGGIGGFLATPTGTSDANEADAATGRQSALGIVLAVAMLGVAIFVLSLLFG